MEGLRKVTIRIWRGVRPLVWEGEGGGGSGGNTDESIVMQLVIKKSRLIALLVSMRGAVLALTGFGFAFGVGGVGVFGGAADCALHRVPHAAEEDGAEQVLERDERIVDAQQQ